MVTPNHNFIETPDGDIMPSYAAGHGNQPYYPHVDTEQPDFFHAELGEGVDELEQNHAESGEGVQELELIYSDAIARGIARAEAFMNNPDEHGDRWPTIRISQEHEARQSKVVEMPGRNRGHVNPLDQPITTAEVLKGKTPEEVSKQAAVYHAGAVAAREILRSK